MVVVQFQPKADQPLAGVRTFVQEVNFKSRSQNSLQYAVVVQLVERFLAKEEVAGSNPVCRSSKHQLIG